MNKNAEAPNYSAMVYTETGSRVRKVMCLTHLTIRKHDLVNKNDTNLVRKPCDYCTRYQPEPTSLVWGCGHTASVYLHTDAVTAAEQIAAYTQIDCLPCAKQKKAQYPRTSINDVGARN